MVAKKVAKKTPPKKAVKVPAKKVAKKAVKKTAAPRTRSIEQDVHGFTVGSDMSIIVNAMVEGGADRQDVINKAKDALPTMVTRGGVQKNVPSVISALIPKLKELGYTVDSHWQIVPPGNIKQKITNAAKREASATKKVAKKVAKK